MRTMQGAPLNAGGSDAGALDLAAFCRLRESARLLTNQPQGFKFNGRMARQERLERHWPGRAAHARKIKKLCSQLPRRMQKHLARREKRRE